MLLVGDNFVSRRRRMMKWDVFSMTLKRTFFMFFLEEEACCESVEAQKNHRVLYWAKKLSFH